MNVTDLSRLTESPGPMLKHPQGGARYHPADQIISHLNYCFGPDGWDWEELDYGFDEMGDQVWVRGKLTARFLGHADDHDGYKTTVCTKIERGWNAVKRRRDNGTLVNLGDDYKGADTDALKRAARLLGVGLDAWEKDGGAAREQRQQQPTPQRPAQTGNAVGPTPLHDAERAAILTGAPATSEDRPALLARYGELLDHATKMGFHSSWVGTARESLSDIQLQKYSGLLENYIARNTEAAS